MNDKTVDRLISILYGVSVTAILLGAFLDFSIIHMEINLSGEALSLNLSLAVLKSAD
jgi:hypothetical protein